MSTPTNMPQEIKVVTDAQRQPIAITAKSRRRQVVMVRNQWRIDDEWWRDEISRTYFEVLLSDGSLCTVFQDLITGKWYRQRY
jgi:hypothetical protein